MPSISRSTSACWSTSLRRKLERDPAKAAVHHHRTVGRLPLRRGVIQRETAAAAGSARPWPGVEQYVDARFPEQSELPSYRCGRRPKLPQIGFVDPRVRATRGTWNIAASGRDADRTPTPTSSPDRIGTGAPGLSLCAATTAAHAVDQLLVGRAEVGAAQLVAS
jgi:hypothetical protein